MTIRSVVLVVLLLGLSGPAVRAADPAAEEQMARFIKANLIARMPREYEDKSAWGGTTPVIEGLRLANRRERLRVGDHDEWPDGPWVRTKVRVDNPDKDVVLKVSDVRPSDHKTTLLHVEATVTVRAERERQQWRRGLRLLDVTARADAVVVLNLDVDAKIGLDGVKPTVTRAQIDLKDFELLNVRGALDPETARTINNEIRAFLQQELKRLEPVAAERLNEMLQEAQKK